MADISINGFDIRTRPLPSEIPSLTGDTLLDRLYASRGISHPDQLNTQLSSMIDYRSLKGLDHAIELLLRIRQQNGWVLVVGDYDTDGATATALAVQGLNALGVQADFLLPNRFEFGYGLSVGIAELALEQKPSAVMTVDNGIASLEGVALLENAGVPVLITDHHLPGDQLPAATAIVNPNQPECPFPSKAACGCTVVFYLLIALRANLREQGVNNLPNLAQWLDIVALATIADVVPLDDNNRRLVAQGLQRIQQGHLRPGLRALFEVTGREPSRAQASDFGFAIAPRLNAAGRLDDMTLGVRLLLTDSPAEARVLAQQLHDLNQERRSIEQSMLADIEASLPALPSAEGLSAWVVHGPDWHEGVIGIVAARVKERLHRPVIALADAGDGTLKGSARSIPGVHIRDCLDWVSKRLPGAILKFGGHAMAAGLTLKADAKAAFEESLSESVHQLGDADALTPHLITDGALSASELTLEQAYRLASAGPWGQAFPEPRFVGAFEVHSAKVVGERHLKLQLRSPNGLVNAIAFNAPESLLLTPPSKVRGVYQLSVNHFRGQDSLQLIFEQLENTL